MNSINRGTQHAHMTTFATSLFQSTAAIILMKYLISLETIIKDFFTFIATFLFKYMFNSSW